ncbi:MAG: hypothetical protein GEV11_01555 [Streptosporangiales bacterium]|nr:hypothetical protein [Streptosporangiales bacterium]
MIRNKAAWAAGFWSRGTAGRETPQELFTLLYRAWLVAFALKVLGSSWDVSWHFKWLRDDLAPPHLLNSVGTAMVVALVIIHGFTGYGADKVTLRLMQWGTGTFLIAVPLDLINHRVNGLDITTWSPSHVLLYLGTALMIAGVIRGWYRGAPRDRWYVAGLTLLWVYFLENLLFPDMQQEYGVLGIAAFDRGEPYAEPSLMKFAADQLGQPVGRDAFVNFALPMPDWVYPMWGLGAAMAVLVVARRTVGARWTATAVAGTYVAYRCLIWPLLVLGTFPPSAVPFYLVAGAVCVDLAFRAGRLPDWKRACAGAVLVTVGGYAGLYVQGELLVAPPISYPSAVFTAVCLAMLWLLADRLFSGPSAAAQATAARVSTTASP